jgi:hypothetical protein
MKITKTQLKKIIKEEMQVSLREAKIKDFIKSSAIHSSIPAGSLMRVLMKNPDIRDQARNAANPQGQMQAFQQIAALLAQDPDIKRAIGDDPLEKHLDVKGLLRYAEQNMPQLWS